MSNRGSVSKGLFVICMVVGLATSQTTKCQPKATLDNLSLTLLATPTTTKDDLICTKSFLTGYCVDKTAVKTKMEEMVAWYKKKAIDAQNFGNQFINATVFFQIANGHLTATATATDAGLFSSILNSLKWVLSKFVNLFQLSKEWVRSIFSTHVSSINPCFQAYANITNGAICTLTGNADVAVGDVKTTSFVTLKVDLESTGASLVKCFDLIDVYCSITHGVSIKNTGDVFNITLSTDFADGGLTKEECTTLRNNWATVDAAAVNVRYTFLVNKFQHNYLPFVPSAESIINLGKYYTVATPDKTVKYTTVAQTNSVKGIALVISDTPVKLNIYDHGKSSGIPIQYYSSKILGAKVMLMVLIGLVSRF